MSHKLKRALQAVAVIVLATIGMITYLVADPPPEGQEFVYNIAMVIWALFVFHILWLFATDPDPKNKMDRSNKDDERPQ